MRRVVLCGGDGVIQSAARHDIHGSHGACTLHTVGHLGMAFFSFSLFFFSLGFLFLVIDVKRQVAATVFGLELTMTKQIEWRCNGLVAK